MCKKEKIKEKANKFGCRCLSVLFALIFACGMNTEAVGRNISSGNIAENFSTEVAHEVLQVTGKSIVETKDRQIVEVEYVVTSRDFEQSTDKMYKVFGECFEDSLIGIRVDDIIKIVISFWTAKELINHPDVAGVEIKTILKEVYTLDFRFTNVALHKSSRAKKRRALKTAYPSQEGSEMIVNRISSASY